jgi:hypothetical protein
VLNFEALAAPIEANSEFEFAHKKSGFSFAYETCQCFWIRFKNGGAVESLPR